MKVYLKSFGCSANFAEGEMMQGLLAKHFSIVLNSVDAEIIIMNICTVKGENNAFREIKKMHEELDGTPHKKLIVAGCVTKELIEKIRKLNENISVLNTHNVNHIIEVVEETINENPVFVLSEEEFEKINLPRIKANKSVGIVLSSQGCKSRCTYCSVVLIKGLLKSYSIEKIKQEVARFVRDGASQIWLTSQDMGCYGEDIGTNLVELLRELVKIPGDFKIRVGMANPRHVKNYIDELIEVFKHEKIFKFLHLPVQSGNDEILKKMLRMNTVLDFETIVKNFRAKIPEITISTDIIVGFPTETNSQFQDTLDMLARNNLEIINISRFMRRAGTLSNKMKQISGDVIKDRSRKLSSQYEWAAFERQKKWVGWQGEIIIEEHDLKGNSMGRNNSYRPVIVAGKYKLGAKINVKIIAYTVHHFKAEVIN